jgi:predicted amidohydrolase
MTDDRRRTFTAQLSLLLNDGSLAKRAQLCVKRALRFDSATTMDEFYRTCARAAVRNARRPSDHRRQILPSSLSELKGYDLPAIPGTAWIPDSLACRLRDWWFSEFF